MIEVQDNAVLESILDRSADEDVVFYKHSTRCNLCTQALEAVRSLCEKNPQLCVAYIDVVEHRDVSLALAETVGVTHQSPQAIWLRSGAPICHLSHRDITLQALEANL